MAFSQTKSALPQLLAVPTLPYCFLPLFLLSSSLSFTDTQVFTKQEPESLSPHLPLTWAVTSSCVLHEGGFVTALWFHKLSGCNCFV